MEMGHSCKGDSWIINKTKNTSIPNDDVLKSARVLHKYHISCQANEQRERLALRPHVHKYTH